MIFVSVRATRDSMRQLMNEHFEGSIEIGEERLAESDLPSGHVAQALSLAIEEISYFD